ncbi:MAG: 50S ribosomal protein L21 [Actinomycetota bacterium]|nr:50S ribosomal protein L21 [Actinomycetota bacterium]
MTYAIIRVGGKQYRVREGERLLVDRLGQDEGATFSPDVLFVGGDGDAGAVTVTARVIGQRLGEKIRIGKYRRRTGYRRHTGFRSRLSEIQIESIGAAGGKAARQEKAAGPLPPTGYEGMTVAEVGEHAKGWDLPALEAALAYERSHGKRKGAVSALESAIQRKQREEDS